jgi:hypothetical protein
MSKTNVVLGYDIVLPVDTMPGDVSDGLHTFNELYEYRMMYNAALFNEWATQKKYHVHKSKRHHDGEKCFGSSNWFVVVALLPEGQISNHYEMKHWYLFNIPELDKVAFEYDGHTPQESLNRLRTVVQHKEP